MYTPSSSRPPQPHTNFLLYQEQPCAVQSWEAGTRPWQEKSPAPLSIGSRCRDVKGAAGSLSHLGRKDQPSPFPSLSLYHSSPLHSPCHSTCSPTLTFPISFTRKVLPRAPDLIGRPLLRVASKTGKIHFKFEWTFKDNFS